jgi:hypothetical protein
MQKKTSAVGRLRPVARAGCEAEPADPCATGTTRFPSGRRRGEMIMLARRHVRPCRRFERGRGCERCDSTDCHCDCCVNDADLVVQAHA